MKKVLDEIKGEVVVLKRTETILKQRTENVDAFMKELEQKQGIQGYSNVEDQIQGVSELKERLDNAKSKSLEELNQLIQQIESEVKDKKNRLAPEIKKLRTLRTRYSEIEKVHNEKKKIYDQVSSTIEMERERIDKDIGTTFKEYKESESKFHQNNIQSEIYESFSSRINSEAKHVSNPEKRLSQEFKSYQEFFNAKLRQQENVMKDLRAHQRHIKDNSDNFGTQM